jgi:hypothetical protein
MNNKNVTAEKKYLSSQGQPTEVQNAKTSEPEPNMKQSNNNNPR